MSGKTDFSKTDDSTQNQSCPLEKAYIVPVRYALDESPTQGGLDDNGDPLEHSAPHGFPDKWHGQPSGYPTLKTRSYTLRQLRDGWLYVYDPSTEELSELTVSGSSFGGAAFLTFDLNQSAQLAYSSMQWTDRIKTRVTEDGGFRSHLMKAVYPAATTLQLTLAKLGTVTYWPADCGPIDALGEAVADLAGKPVDNFESTTTPTRALTADEQGAGPYPLMSYKAPASAGAYTAVPEPENAFFVALEDTLALADDLLLQLEGRNAERANTTKTEEGKLLSANLVQRLCGVEVDAYLPTAVRIDPERYLQATRLIYDYLDAENSQLIGSDHTMYVKGINAQRIKAQLVSLGATSTPNLNSDEVTEWKAKQTSREVDVHFDQAIEYACRENSRNYRCDYHVDAAAKDTIAVLKTLPEDPEYLGLDCCDESQTSAMITFAARVIDILGSAPSGRAWINDQLGHAQGLIGLSTVNFSAPIRDALDQIAKNYVNTGTPDGDETDIVPSIGTLNNLMGRANETAGFLNEDRIKNSSIYQQLDAQIKQRFETLKAVVTGTTGTDWQKLIFHSLAAIPSATDKSKRALLAIRNALLMSALPDQIPPAVINSTFINERQAWKRELNAALANIKATQRSLAAATSTTEAATLRNTLHSQTRTLQGIMNSQPLFMVISGEDMGQSLVKQLFQERIEVGSNAFKARATAFIDGKGGLLPLGVAAFNIFNFIVTLSSAEEDGDFDAEDVKSLISNGAYTANALTALWVLPFWQRFAERTVSAVGGREAEKVTNRAISVWRDAAEGSPLTRAGERRVALKAADLASKLRMGVMALGAFQLIAAGVETWQSYGQYQDATNATERLAAATKGTATLAMGAAGGLQFLGAALGKWYGFSWVMSTAFTFVAFAAGAIYLIASFFYARYHREGLRVWLNHCFWGNAQKWGTDFELEQREFRRIILKPALVLKPIGLEVMGTISFWGYWGKLILPGSLHDQHIQLSDNAVLGHWTESGDDVNDLPDTRPSGGPGTDTVYSNNDSSRLWAFWAPSDAAFGSSSRTPLRVVVAYPSEVTGNPIGVDYYVFDIERDQASHTITVEPTLQSHNTTPTMTRLDIP